MSLEPFTCWKVFSASNSNLISFSLFSMSCSSVCISSFSFLTLLLSSWVKKRLRQIKSNQIRSGQGQRVWKHLSSRHLLTLEYAEMLKKAVLHFVATSFTSIFCDKWQQKELWENIKDRKKMIDLLVQNNNTFPVQDGQIT